MHDCAIISWTLSTRDRVMISDANSPSKYVNHLHNAHRSDTGLAIRRRSGEAIDARLMPLLEAIASTASLAAAVVACGISYRAGVGTAARLRAKVRRAARASRARSRREPHGAGRAMAARRRRLRTSALPGYCRASRSTSDRRPARANARRHPRLARRRESRPRARGAVRDAARVGRGRPRAVGDGKPHRACGNSAKAAPTSPASTCRSARTRAGIARPSCDCAARAARQAHPLRRSRAGPDPRRAAIRRTCGVCATSPSAICASSIASAAREPGSSSTGCSPTSASSASRSKASATKSSRIPRWRRRSPPAARTPASACAPPPPNTGSPSFRWCASATSSPFARRTRPSRLSSA